MFVHKAFVRPCNAVHPLLFVFVRSGSACACEHVPPLHFRAAFHSWGWIPLRLLALGTGVHAKALVQGHRRGGRRVGAVAGAALVGTVGGLSTGVHLVPGEHVGADEHVGPPGA